MIQVQYLYYLGWSAQHGLPKVSLYVFGDTSSANYKSSHGHIIVFICHPASTAVYHPALFGCVQRQMGGSCAPGVAPLNMALQYTRMLHCPACGLDRYTSGRPA